MGNLLFHASDEEYWENIPQDKSRGKVKNYHAQKCHFLLD